MEKPDWLLKIEEKMPNEDVSRDYIMPTGFDVSEELKDFACPNCKNRFLFDTELFWLVPEGEPIKKEDEIVKCAYCWQNYTFGYVKKVNEDGLSL